MGLKGFLREDRKNRKWIFTEREQVFDANAAKFGYTDGMNTETKQLIAQFFLIMSTRELRVTEGSDDDRILGELLDVAADAAGLPRDENPSGDCGYRGDDDYCRDWFYDTHAGITDMAVALALVEECQKEGRLWAQRKARQATAS